MSTADAPAEQVRALLFSPDPLRAYHYRERLELDGYEVQATGDAIDAFRMLRSQAPDLVFVDVQGDRTAADVLLTLLGRDTTPARVPVVCIDLRPWRPPSADFDQPAGEIAMSLVEPGAAAAEERPAETKPGVKLPAAS